MAKSPPERLAAALRANLKRRKAGPPPVQGARAAPDAPEAIEKQEENTARAKPEA